jgi:hypothetical protein
MCLGWVGTSRGGMRERGKGVAQVTQLPRTCDDDRVTSTMSRLPSSSQKV